MTVCRIQKGRRVVTLISRDEYGNTLDALEVLGENAGRNGYSSGVELGDKELKTMWHAPRTREETPIVGMPGAMPGADVIEVRRWVMRLITMETENATWTEVERRLWRLTTPDRLRGSPGFFYVHYQERDGTAREIQVKRTGTPEPQNDTLPGTRGHESWSFEVTAYDPMWYGQPEEDVWEPSGSGSHVLRVRNPGDQDGHFRYLFPAANGAATWTVPDGLGVYPEGHTSAGGRIMHTLPRIDAGQVAEADSRPYRLPFRILGLPMSFGLMKQARFTNPLPADSGLVELPVSVDTAATNAAIRVQVLPAYDRPSS